MDPKPLQFDPDIGCLAGPPAAFAALRRAVRAAQTPLDLRAVAWLKRLTVQPHLDRGLALATVRHLEALADAVARPDFRAFVRDNADVHAHTTPWTASAQFALAVAAASDPVGLAAYGARAADPSWADRIDAAGYHKEARAAHGRFPTLDDYVGAVATAMKTHLPRTVEPAPQTMLDHFEIEGAALTTYPDLDALARAVALDLRKTQVSWADKASRSTPAYPLRYERQRAPSSFDKRPVPHVFYVFLDMFYERLADGANTTYGNELTRLRRQVAGKAGSMRRTMKHLQAFADE